MRLKIKALPSNDIQVYAALMELLGRDELIIILKALALNYDSLTKSMEAHRVGCRSQQVEYTVELAEDTGVVSRYTMGFIADLEAIELKGVVTAMGLVRIALSRQQEWYRRG